MAKYRRRNDIVFEAEQWFPGKKIDGVCLDLECDDDDKELGPHIHTLEGILHVSEGDWILTGILNEHWPVKPDIFAKTYISAE